MDGPTLALGVTILTHLLGAAFLIAMLIRLDGSGPGDIRRGWWDDEGPDAPPAAGPGGRPGGRALPLPDAAPSPVRRRGEEATGPLRPRPTRRPEHLPADPARVPSLTD